MTTRLLLEAALAARDHAHAPYSGFRVGAALLDAQGRVHAGANVENAAYPLGLCAEAVALGQLVAAGGGRVTAALVVAEGARLIVPCGGCRQRLAEFACESLPVHLARPREGVVRTVTLGALLPEAFSFDRSEAAR